MWEWNLYLRFLLEYAMMIPGLVCCFLPVISFLRFKPLKCFFTTAVLVLIMIFAGAAISTFSGLSSAALVLLFMIPLFFVYRFCCTLSLTRLLFVIFHAMFLATWCTDETLFIFSPLEAGVSGPFTVTSGIFCLILSAGTVALYYRFLTVYLPILFEVPALERLWKVFFLVPAATLILQTYLKPQNPANMMVGRIRPISIVVNLLLLFIVWGFYYFFWYISERITQEENLKRENLVLKAEEERYRQLHENLMETRRVRHDYRQHVRVMHELVTSGQFDRLRQYLDEYEGNLSPQHVTFSTNPVVDAIAAYYDQAAQDVHTRIFWQIRLPDNMPVGDNAYCVILGNLLENALNAVADLPEENRNIRVSAQMIGDSMLGTSVSNPYEGSIPIGKDGFPVMKDHQGIGLTSVAYEVQKHGGTMAVETLDGIFSVSIVFNL